MSSEVEVGGMVAAAVALPAAAAYGAGWLLWQSGKLLVEANRTANRIIAEKKQQIAEAEKHRKLAAFAAHSQFKDMCAQILAQLDSAENTIGLAETEQLKRELRRLINQALPEDTMQLESLTSLGYLELDSIIKRQQKLADFQLEEASSGLYRGLSVADLMDDLRIAICAMKLRETKGTDAAAVEPDVLERAKLNAAFAEVAASITQALQSIEELTRTYGLTPAAKAWFHSCFNGVDVQIGNLCRPTTTNKELKKGIRRLQDSFAQYEAMAQSIEENAIQIAALYPVYAEAAAALGEPVLRKSEFNEAAEIEKKLRYLQKRSEKAQECAEIYKALGPSAYLCYAWDQELQAMGYEVHSRQEISQMAEEKPTHAMVNGNKLPFYQWTDDDLTQLYSIGAECALQVIVHGDGSVTMKTIAESENDEAVAEQSRHCSKMQKLHERLRENWFILYDYEQTAAPDVVTTVSEWRVSEGNAWRKEETQQLPGRRSKESQTKKPRQEHM